MANITAHNANVWVNCSGALSLQSKHPKPRIEGEEIPESAKEGLAFHEIATRILKSIYEQSDDRLHCENFVGQLSSHGLPFDDDMYYHAREYVNNVLAVYNNAGQHRELHIEERLDLDAINDGSWSFADCWVVNPSTRVITIWDAKYGRSLVEVFENWQLLCYAIGLINKIPNVDRLGWTFDLRVFQPRAFHRDGILRSWVVTSEELRSYENIMVLAAEKSNQGGTCKTGTWCYNASCNRTCETYQRQVYDGLDYVGESVGNDLTGTNLAIEIVQLQHIQDQLKARLKGLEESAIVHIRKGESLPGLIAQETYGRKAWRKDIDQNEVISMGDLLGVDLRKPRELATPTQVLKKGIDASVINEYSETPKTGWKLATTDRIKMMFNVK
jgi:hypothetical protein